MKIFPAIDIINGKCVRLTKGLAENKTIYDKSPVEMAKIYQDKGFETIHVVDLDATLGKGSNDKTLELIRKNIDIKIGNSLELKDIPPGTSIHNVELIPGNGAKLARSAGTSVTISGIDGNYS